MTDAAEHRFKTDRYLTLNSILSVIETHEKAIPATLIIDIHAMSPSAMKDSADKEAWGLLARGIRHLKDGAPGGEPGSMTEALAKTSLRSSSLASSVGVKPPQFQQMYYNVEYETGFEAAVFFTKRLIEAAEGDLSKSRQIIQQKIYNEKPVGAFGIMTDIADPELRDIFDAVTKASGIKTPDGIRVEPETNVSPESLQAMRKQMIMSFNMLSESYAEACKTLRNDLATLTPPAPPKFTNKGQSFDF